MKSRLSLLLLLCLFSLWSCEPSPEKKAKELIERSIEAHGGSEAWEKISILKFRKKTRLYNEDGTVESELDQEMEFRLKPRLEGKITWEKDSIKHVLSWDGVQMRYFMGENEVKNPAFLASKKKDFDAAYYTISQPWGLLGDGATLTYEGQKTLENGKTVESVRVDYGSDTDLWFYYFDPNSVVMVGNEVHAKDHRSLIYDLSLVEHDGLKFHGQRDSWRIDERGKRLFLRAEYVYSDYEITY
ncbi:hypothetical protein J0A67_02710 [Algoriphagus aestuariicola]|uniref:Lipoprotein n=1 Tax=Algoriphagus aestuariicola TaxID=1852016 RepID=A0ABS3BKD2_9BACT|nr:DUF6503 family protein [Algoriphagus aestuariicola]MBN7799751.1 hypothetical protein [Algoriphagus aestuariicola]